LISIKNQALQIDQESCFRNDLCICRLLNIVYLSGERGDHFLFTIFQAKLKYRSPCSVFLLM